MEQPLFDAPVHLVRADLDESFVPGFARRLQEDMSTCHIGADKILGWASGAVHVGLGREIDEEVGLPGPWRSTSFASQMSPLTNR